MLKQYIDKLNAVTLEEVGNIVDNDITLNNNDKNTFIRIFS